MKWTFFNAMQKYLYFALPWINYIIQTDEIRYYSLVFKSSSGVK